MFYLKKKEGEKNAFKYRANNNVLQMNYKKFYINSF